MTGTGPQAHDASQASPGPFANLRIIDLSRVLAGPWCTQTLADFGAEVIKIERPGTGDDSRGWGPPFLDLETGGPPAAAYFCCTNRGKKSVTVDFTSPQGQATLIALASVSDVFVENFLPGTMARYGLDYASLRKVNPRLIYCSITGYGQTGPYAMRPGYDGVIQGVGGMMSVTGEADGMPGGGPQRVGLPMIDMMTGLYATIGIMTALWERETSGEGQLVNLSLLDVQVSALAPIATSYFVTGKLPQRNGTRHPTVVPSDVFQCRDGPMQLTVGNDSQFQKLSEALGEPGLAADPRFAGNAGRAANLDELTRRLRELIARKDRIALVEQLSRLGVPCGPINNLAEVFADPQVQESGMVVHFEADKGSAVSVVANPLRMSRTPARYERRPPVLGENTQEVLDMLAQAAGRPPAER